MYTSSCRDTQDLKDSMANTERLEIQVLGDLMDHQDHLVLVEPKELQDKRDLEDRKEMLDQL